MGFECFYCGFSSKFKSNLARHILRHFNKNKRTSKSVYRCLHSVGCQFECNVRSDMLKHYVNTHEINISVLFHKFSSSQEFMEWKEELEKQEHCRFVKAKGMKKSKNHCMIKYICHREGFYRSKGKGQRHLKSQGSNKMNNCCPAGLSVKIKNDGYHEVTFTTTHVGHDISLSRLSLSKSDRESIGHKLKQNIPFDSILDDVRNNIFEDNVERIHLLTRKDLSNISRSYDIGSQVVKQNRSDNTSAQSWIDEMRENSNIIRFYKPRDSMIEGHQQFKSEDLILIIANDAQLEIVRKFAKKCITFDSTNSLSTSRLKLTIMIVLDESDQGFPGAFMVSSRVDTDVVALFITVVRESLRQDLTTDVLMTDVSEIYYNAWCQVLPPPTNHLFASWHVENSWRKNLKKIKDPQKRVRAYRMLTKIQKETNHLLFPGMLQAAVDELLNDQDCRSFGGFFQNTYSMSAKYWAHCYRHNLGIEINRLEDPMHKVIKHLYAKGKISKRLDRGLNALMRYTRDELFNRMNPVNNDSVPARLVAIRKRHRESLKISPSSLQINESGWCVMSPNGRKSYDVFETNNNCSCPLRCESCDCCIHAFKCTCPDSFISWHMCKHIHFVASNIQRRRAVQSESNVVVYGDLFEVHEDVDEDVGEDAVYTAHAEVIVETPQKDVYRSNDIEEELIRIKSHFDEVLGLIETHSDLALLKSLVTPIMPTIKANKRQSMPFISI